MTDKGTTSTTVSPDIASMRDSVLFDGPDRSQRISRFWILLVLASIIAAAGVVADSTATVIGAMIVAPLMTPILGAMLSLVLADRANLIRSLLRAPAQRRGSDTGVRRAEQGPNGSVGTSPKCRRTTTA